MKTVIEMAREALEWAVALHGLANSQRIKI